MVLALTTPIVSVAEVSAQRRDGDQTELTIDYVLRAALARFRTTWLLGSMTAPIMLSALWVRSFRSLG